ncbi:MAG: CRISPR-associated protein Cas4 [Dethiobacter sp.]|nr:CRISPR-associated protein Cas4 [Dethiobacter sp.]
MGPYNEDEFLPLSGIQHFAYCARQWGLIHLEAQWVDNLWTAAGTAMHERVDNPHAIESRNPFKTMRSVSLSSCSLGLYGVADVLEVHNGKEHGKYNLVEYKRGKPKEDDCDMVQLCAQAICLEEMLALSIADGHLYYGETKRRHVVKFSSDLRERVHTLATAMHHYYRMGRTPAPMRSAKCQNCSLSAICLPKLGANQHKIDAYLAAAVLDATKN